MMPNIIVVGGGVRSPGQLTLEALKWLRRCELILTILPLSPITDFLASEGMRVESLAHMYQPGALRSDIYTTVVNTVLEAAGYYHPVGYLTSGNPIMVDNMSYGIFKRGGEQGLKVLMLPGISSVDTILVDLKHDIINSGLQIYEASWFVTHAIEPRVDVPCLLQQVNVFGTAFTSVGHDISLGMLTQLYQHLVRFYPPGHPLVSVASPEVDTASEEIISITVKDLMHVSMEHIRSGSLLIPPLHLPTVVNKSFIHQMFDREQHQQNYVRLG